MLTTTSPFLDSLQAYNLNEGTDQMLDLLRKIEASEGYYWRGLACPIGSSVIINGLDSFETQIDIEPDSYVAAFTGVCIRVATQANGVGFNVQIYDVGARVYMSSGSFMWSSGMAGNFGGGTLAKDTPVGPYLPLSPFIVLRPGRLVFQFTNMDPNQCYIQLLLSVAVPMTKSSTGKNIVRAS